MTTQIAKQPQGEETQQFDAERDAELNPGIAKHPPNNSLSHALNVARALEQLHVIIPALNEEQGIAGVLGDLASIGVRNIILIDNGSTDGTAYVARQRGARVIHEPRRGYGSACLAGIAALDDAPDETVVVFLDADGSDDATQLREVALPIIDGSADLVIGSRVLGKREPGALPLHARWGNLLAVWLIARLTGVRYTDLGPFRAIRLRALRELGMRDRDYGWTIEMQLLAGRAGLRVVEVPVRYRRRIGKSKISGTLRGSLAAAAKILWTVVRHVR